MGNDQNVGDIEISPKIKQAINLFTTTLSNIESAKERRALVLNCKVPQEFEFDLNKWIHIARYVLHQDSITAAMRQKCVPSLVKEDEFWKRYFYLVRQEKKRQKKNNNHKLCANSVKPATPETNAESKSEPESTNKNTTIEQQQQHQQQPQEAEGEEEEEDDDDDGTFQLLLHLPVIWLYQIPANIWRGRHNKCKQWELRKPIWCGRLRLVAYRHGQHLQFHFLEKDGSFFLKSTLIKLDKISDDEANPIHRYFDAYGVEDSSRYFIVWVDVPKTKSRKPFGFGVRERQCAFDIRACVADQMKTVRRALDTQGHGDEQEEDNDDGGDEDEYEWVSEQDNDADADGDVLERKCVEITVAANEDEDAPTAQKQKKWYKKIAKVKQKQTHKNRFALRDDEMISIGHDSHSTIFKVTMTETSSGDAVHDEPEKYLLPPPPSPPPNAVLADEDFGDFQAPNSDEQDDTDNAQAANDMYKQYNETQSHER